MNILLLNWRDPQNPKAGGAEIVTLQHAKFWAKNGHSITWLATSYKKSAKEDNIDGIRIIRKGNSISQFIYFPLFYIKNRTQFDIVIDQIHGIPYMTPLYVFRRKIAFIHEVAGSIWDSMFPFPINRLGLVAEKICFLFYKNTPFLTVSESTKKDLQHLGIRTITVIHNGFTLPDERKINKEKNPTFIFISRLVRMKGVEDVIKAFSKITEELPEANLWIVGDGEEEYKKNLHTIVAEFELENRVKFWGKVSEIKKYDLLSKAHILLHASVKEGWGLVILEAASQKTPSVVYNVGGLRDSVKDGQTGLLSLENTPSGLAKTALQLIKDRELYNSLQTKGLAWAKSLTWENATRRSLDLINSL